MNKTFAPALVVAFFVLSCGAMQTGNNNNSSSGEAGVPISRGLLVQYQNCEKDSDCVYIQNGCCDCANGGEDTSININEQQEFQENFDCTNVTCTLIAPLTPCGSGTVSCFSGLCEYTASIGNGF